MPGQASGTGWCGAGGSGHAKWSNRQLNHAMNQGLNQRTVKLTALDPLSFKELEQIKRDVARGYRTFCDRRGLAEDQTFADIIDAECRVNAARKAREVQGE